MFAAFDQENLAHTHHTVAAAKPLNQGIKASVAPKTPGPKLPKTPFKVPLKDEHGRRYDPKTSPLARDKGVENMLVPGKKNDGLDKQAFVTPVAPKNRAPLGMKTTNAKARPFHTPAMPVKNDVLQIHKPSASLRRQKLQIHKPAEAESVSETAKDILEEREIEYMPPRGVDLPDDPDDIYPANQKYPMFEGRNLTRGVWQHFAYPPEEEEKREKKEAEEREEYDRKMNERIMQSLDAPGLIGWDVPEYPGADTVLSVRKEREERAKKEKEGSLLPVAEKRLLSQGPSTLKAQSAVEALHQPSKQSALPRFAAPTAAAKAKLPASIISSKKATGRNSQDQAQTVRHASARAASRSTLGFSKGRAASATLHNERSTSSASIRAANGSRHASRAVQDQQGADVPFPKHKLDPTKPSFDLELWIQARGLGITSDADDEAKEDEEEAMPAWTKAPIVGLEEEDEYANFQLVVPELE